MSLVDDDNLSVSSIETQEDPYNNADIQFYDDVKAFAEDMNANIDDVNEEVISYIRQTAYDLQDPVDDMIEIMKYYEFRNDRYRERVIEEFYNM